MLPAQILGLAALIDALEIQGAVSVEQKGCVLTIGTQEGQTLNFKINAKGKIINHMERT